MLLSLGVEWELLIYRLPTQPSRARVAVWREVRRLGALPLQQGVVALPRDERWDGRLEEVETRIAAEGGAYYRFRLALDNAQDRRLRAEWNALREQEYAEIIEECETKFAKEIEFEIFRENLTAGEAEEIEADLEKIRGWFSRVQERDVFRAANRRDAEQAIAQSGRLLDDFVEKVFEAEEMACGPVLERPVDLPWGEVGGSQPVDEVASLDRKRRSAKRGLAREDGRKRRGKETG